MAKDTLEDYYVTLSKSTLINYYQFVENLKQLKERQKEITMSLILDNMTNRMKNKGWVRKSNGTVTKGMYTSNVMKFDFIKKYGNVTVTVSLSTNIKDDFLSSSGGCYNEMKVTGSKPIDGRRGWITSKGFCHFEWAPRDDGFDEFVLEKRLDDIDRVNR